MTYVSINSGNRYERRNYNLNGISLVNTIDLLNIQDMECVIILHANDIRDNERLRTELLNNVTKLGWEIYLFTNGGLRGDNINVFQNGIVYTWEEIENSFPVLPPPDKRMKNNLIALSILCQGYLAAHGGDGLMGELSVELKDIAMKRWKDLNLENSWWDIINIDKGNEELKDKKKNERENIENMINEIINKKVSVDKVQKAYDAITRILKK